MRKLQAASLLILFGLWMTAAGHMLGQAGPTSSSNPPVILPLTIANGGTGQATATLAFNALAPCSTQGNVLYYNGTNWLCLGVGTNTQFLQTQGGGANPQWFGVPSPISLACCGASGTNPASGTNYYMGQQAGQALQTSDTSWPWTAPIAGTVTGASGQVVVIGTKDTVANNITFNVRYNGASNLGTATCTATGTSCSWSITGLSQAVAAGETLSLHILTPTFSTLPTVVFFPSGIMFKIP